MVSLNPRTWLRRGEKPLEEEKGVVKRLPYPTVPERPTIAFSDLIEYYEKDSAVCDAIDFMAEACVGVGYYTTADTLRAKNIVDDFAEDVNLDGLLLTGAKEVIAYGNSFWEKIEPNYLENLKILPLSAFKTNFVVRDNFGNITGYVQTVGGQTNPFDPHELIHWKWNVVDCRAEGRGLLHSLAEERKYRVKLGDGTTRTFTIPPLLDIKWRMEDDMRKIFHHYLPRSAWVFPDAPDEWTTSKASVIQKMVAGERIVANRDLKILTESIDPRARFEAFITHFDNQLINGLQTPIIKLFTTPGFTEASAKVVEAQFNRKVACFQRFVKRIVEREIFKPVVEQAGLNWGRANVRLHWGMEERPEFDIKHIIELAKLSAETGIQYIRPEEVRNMLQKIGWELTEKEEEATP